MRSAYTRKRAHLRDVVRVVAEIPAEVIRGVDEWAVPAGIPSRTAALTDLIKRGLASVQAEQSRAA